jgi:acid phosphatase family membrane protein YuiD
MGLKILVCASTGWTVAGIIKLFLNRILSKKWDWRLIFSTGGMPSSHSAFVAAIALAVGLYAGFNTAVFAVAIALAMIVVADATGVRRQAGIHAQRINLILNDLFQGRTLTEKQLKEVLGHTPFEVMAGVITGVVITLLIWLLWK